MENKVGVSDFVKRQAENTGKTYSVLNFNEIATHAESQLKKNKFKNGYREGVILVEVDSSLNDKFICPFVKLDKDINLKAEVTNRRPGEEHYIRVKAINGTELKTGKVELILYRYDVLDETNERSTNYKWELHFTNISF